MMKKTIFLSTFLLIFFTFEVFSQNSENKLSQKEFKEFKTFFDNFQKASLTEDTKWFSENTIFPFIDKDCAAGIQTLEEKDFFELQAPYSISINLNKSWKLTESKIRLFEKNPTSFHLREFKLAGADDIDLAKFIPDKTLIIEVDVDIELHLFFTKLNDKFVFFSKQYCPKPQK